MQMSSYLIKVYFCLLSICVAFFCSAQNDTLKSIYPDKGLVYVIDRYTDSLIKGRNWRYLSLIAMSRYNQSGLLIWDNKKNISARKFYFKKGRWKMKIISKKRLEFRRIKNILEDKCEYSSIFENGKAEISHDFIFRIKTNEQNISFWYSNYLAWEDSCRDDLKYLMRLGF